jgi:uncharacterized protein (DUF58 family)
MIVPSARLIGYTALVVLPLATLAGFTPGAAAPCLVAAAVFAALAAADALRGRSRLEGFRAALPAVARMSVGRATDLPVLLEDPRGRALDLRLAVTWPEGIEPEPETLETRLPGPGSFQASWVCTPRRRGQFAISTVHAETPSPWGLWAVRKSIGSPCEVRVYPGLGEDRKRLAALFLNRGMHGIHAQRRVGQGREFEQLREYIPGDSRDDIHWKATAKRGRPVTKVYQIERTQEVYVLLDASRLSARRPGGSDTPQIERFLSAALVLGLAAEQQGDRFGVLVFSDRVEKFVRAGGGRTHYGACRDALYTVEPRVVNPDFDELSAFVRMRMRRRALLVVLTSLDDPVLAEAFTRCAGLLGGRHLVVANMLEPEGVAPLFARAAGEGTDGVAARLAGHLQWHDLMQLERVLRHRGVAFSLLPHERLAVDLVSQYIGVKQRQAL